MSMIETVARASHAFFQPIYKLPPWEEIPKDAQSLALQHARACVAAMENPTKAMVLAAAGYRIEQAATGHDCEAQDIWGDMLRAADAGQ